MPADPYKYFRVEARELLEQLGQAALDLEKGVPSADAIARVLRLAHTLKGAARVVKQPQIAEHAHELEDLFTAVRDSPERASQEQIDRVLMLLDQIGVRVAALAPGADTQAKINAGRQQHEPPHSVRPEVADLEMLAGGVAEAQGLVGGLRPRLEQADRIRHLIDLIDTQLVRVRARDATPADRSAIEKTLSMIEELRRRFGALERGIASAIDEMERELRQVSDTAARLRLVPANAMFRFLERAARDVAQALGKRVTFQARGGDVGVDGRMITIVQGALLQLVRNAVAHGIEPSGSERIAAGKPADGRVTVSVARRGTSVSFICSDDGRGIDFDAVRRTLHRKGVSAAERQTLDADSLLRLLLKGGISTSGTVTDVAGRGIGLDVVREAAERLSGDVSMQSEPGRGTTVDIVVPTSIASFPALLVEAARVPVAIPLDAVRRTIRVTRQDIVATPQGESILDDGRSIPLVSLLSVIRPAERRHTEPGGPSSGFVIEAGNGAAAFTVDRVVGTGSVVLRALPDFAPATPVIVGASLDAGGEPRLVLDPAGLVAEAQRVATAERDTPAARPAILIVDDSLTTRMLEQSILESAGYDVSVASSGEEGLDKARAGKYALFLVDVEMPGIDGFTFIEQVRSDPMLRSIPSILVTSRASAEDQQRGRDVGAHGYIVKSDFDQGTLLEHIRTLVQ